MDEIHEKLTKAIKRQNIIEGHAVISTLLCDDKWLRDVKTPFLGEYADKEFKKQGVDFFVKDDGETDFPSKEKWNFNLWKSMRVDLEENFSKKKFDFIIEIMKHLRETGHPEFQADKSSQKTQNKKNVQTKTDYKVKDIEPKPIKQKEVKTPQVNSANSADDFKFIQEKSQTSKEPKKTQPKKSSSNDFKLTKTGAVIGGVLGLGIGAIFGKPVIGAVIGAGILGVLGFTKDNK